MPYTGTVLSILAIALGLYLILVSHWLVAAGLFPKTVSQFEHQYGQRPVRATLVGLLTFGPLLFLLLNSAKIGHPALRLIAVVLGFGTLLAALFGSAGLALRIGNGLCPEANRWQRMMRGGSMLSLCFLTPLVGTFFVLPLGLCSGFGVFLLSRPWRSESPTSLPDSISTAPASSL